MSGIIPLKVSLNLVIEEFEVFFWGGGVKEGSYYLVSLYFLFLYLVIFPYVSMDISSGFVSDF